MSFVEERIRCEAEGEAEGQVELFGGEVCFCGRRDGWDGCVANKRGPFISFGVVYNPTFTGVRVGGRAGEVEGVEESCVVRTERKGEGDLA
jgi:hypothetical protein